MTRFSMSQFTLILFLGFLAGLSGCSSKGPATTYYLIDSVEPSSKSEVNANSIGVGPIALPAYLENTAIITRTKNNILKVSGYNAWAEPLERSAARTLGSQISKTLDNSKVWSFPWDSRNRPQKQISIVIDQLDGVRGESVSLRANWFIYQLSSDSVIGEGSFSRSVELSGSSYSDYVEGIEQVLNDFAKELSTHLQ